MAEINIPTGPIQVAPWNAITHAPGEGFNARRGAIVQALDGVDLGEWDRAIVDWLAGRDNPTAVTVCSWLIRVRAAAQGGEG